MTKPTEETKPAPDYYKRLVKQMQQQGCDGYCALDECICPAEPTEGEIEAAARASHDAYEEAAKLFGWDTKPECKVVFNDLPEANKKTMMVAMKAALQAAASVRMKGEIK